MVPVNYLAVFLAAVASMVLGFAWYSPMVLGIPWMKLKGFTSEGLKKEQAKMGPMYGLSFVGALLTAYVLSHVIAFSENYFHYSMLMTGLTSAFWMWLGFILPVQMTATIFGDKKWQLLGIDTGYQLVSVLAMGFVIGLIG